MLPASNAPVTLALHETDIVRIDQLDFKMIEETFLKSKGSMMNEAYPAGLPFEALCIALHRLVPVNPQKAHTADTGTLSILATPLAATASLVSPTDSDHVNVRGPLNTEKATSESKTDRQDESREEDYGRGASELMIWMFNAVSAVSASQGAAIKAAATLVSESAVVASGSHGSSLHADVNSETARQGLMLSTPEQGLLGFALAIARLSANLRAEQDGSELMTSRVAQLVLDLAAATGKVGRRWPNFSAGTILLCDCSSV